MRNAPELTSADAGVRTPLDWVIVGGGPHGVHLATSLIGSANVPQHRLRIVDPGIHLMDNWFRRTGNTGMTHLRSPDVHHLDLSPFSLRRFAATPKGKTLPGPLFRRPYNRPSVDLFKAHCAMVIEQNHLEDIHLRSRVSSIDLEPDAVRLTLDDGRSLYARQIILAMGASEQPRYPRWSHRADQRIQHILRDGFTLEPKDWTGRVVVVGAGISGAQAALRLAKTAKSVTLVTRHQLRKHHFDSDPGWIGPKYMTRFSNTKSPVKRRQIISKARQQGSLSPRVHRLLRMAIHSGIIRLLKGKISTACLAEDAIRLATDAGPLVADKVLLATGFEPKRPGGALIDDLIARESLPCSCCGFPLVDWHLRWHPRVFLSGPLAELEVGPVARNLVGARRAAERIVPIAQAQGATRSDTQANTTERALMASSA